MSNFIYYEKLQDYEEQVRKAKEYDKLQQELQRKDNNWNELKKWVENMIFNKVGSSVDIAIENHAYCKILDKIKELEESK